MGRTVRLIPQKGPCEVTLDHETFHSGYFTGQTRIGCFETEFYCVDLVADHAYWLHQEEMRNYKFDVKRS